MEKCPSCGHWMLNYNPVIEKWVCYCHTVIYHTPRKDDCHCNYELPESIEGFNKRLLEENCKGRYSVSPPT